MDQQQPMESQESNGFQESLAMVIRNIYHIPGEKVWAHLLFELNLPIESLNSSIVESERRSTHRYIVEMNAFWNKFGFKYVLSGNDLIRVIRLIQAFNMKFRKRILAIGENTPTFLQAHGQIETKSYLVLVEFQVISMVYRLASGLIVLFKAQTALARRKLHKFNTEQLAQVREEVTETIDCLLLSFQPEFDRTPIDVFKNPKVFIAGIRSLQHLHAVISRPKFLVPQIDDEEAPAEPLSTEEKIQQFYQRYVNLPTAVEFISMANTMKDFCSHLHSRYLPEVIRPVVSSPDQVVPEFFFERNAPEPTGRMMPRRRARYQQRYV